MYITWEYFAIYMLLTSIFGPVSIHLILVRPITAIFPISVIVVPIMTLSSILQGAPKSNKIMTEHIKDTVKIF